MKPSLSQFGIQMSKLTGVRAIMKDIIETLRSGGGQEFINLSAGNPVILPQVRKMWRDYTKELLDKRKQYGEVVCRYGSSQGYEPLIEAIANYFNREYGWNLTDRNILITPGSQSIYFYAANIFGGYTENKQLKEIVLPLSPDYTGYGGVSLYPEAVVAYQPNLDINESDRSFKYRPDFDRLKINETTGCVIFSRPCNPTGNVLTDEEVSKIADLAANYNVPVLIDSAYAPPFPALNFTPMTPILRDNVIHCLSLSKAGLPGERIGVAIGKPELINLLECFQTNLCIHSSRYGQAIAARAIESGKLAKISRKVICPYYQNKFEIVQNTLDRSMPKDLPWFLHKGEGAIFSWLWLRDLPISDWDLYQELKKVGVIVVPGNSFFPGLREEWQHKRECIRISLTASDKEIETGMQRLAGVIEKVYREGKV